MKLIECAFCGSKEAMVRSCSVEGERKSFNCECPQCFCSGPRAATMWQASVLWNTRNGMVIEREAPGLSSGIAIQLRRDDQATHEEVHSEIAKAYAKQMGSMEIELPEIPAKKKRGRPRKKGK